MTLLAPHPAATAPQDGRVIRGWFRDEREPSAAFQAVSWAEDRACWVNLLGEPVPDSLQLEGWGPE